jgi:hypothetical protein
MLNRDGHRWLTPKNVLVVFLLLVQTTILLWLMWNEIDLQRHPATFDLPPVAAPRVKP